MALILMTHFAATETNRSLHLIAVFQEFHGLIQLGLEVVFADIQRKTDFFNLYDFLIFSGFFFPFCLVRNDTCRNR